MRAFQDEGHIGVLIIGDYTTRIGDPSGRSAERPILSDEEIDANAKTYLEQAMVVLDPEQHRGAIQRRVARRSCRTRRSSGSRARSRSRGMLERDDFAKRMAAQQPISVSELLYPLMQAYDSVAIEADVELGGTDQLYNLLAGRDVMAHYGLEPQVVLTTPLLLSWDGEKMSSSVGNNIPLTAPPEEMFGRTMRIPDELLPEWWRLVAEQAPPAGEPMASKLALARWIVARSHGERGGARRPRSTSRASSAAARRPEEVAGGGAPGGRPGAPAGAARRRRFGVDVDLGGAAPDRAGRREARRRAGRRARRAARERSTARCCRSASAGSRASV